MQKNMKNNAVGEYNIYYYAKPLISELGTISINKSLKKKTKKCNYQLVL